MSFSKTLYMLLCTGSPRKKGNHPDMTEQLFTGTQSIETNKNKPVLMLAKRLNLEGCYFTHVYHMHQSFATMAPKVQGIWAYV